MNCPSCQSQLDPFATVWIRSGKYWLCPKCHLIWDDSRNKLKALGNDYTSHKIREVKSSLGVQHYVQHLLPYLPPPGSSVLELGGGYGHLAHLLNLEHNLDITIVEPGQQGRQYAETRFGIPAYENLISLKQNQNAIRFDLIFSGHVWEHVDDPNTFLSQSAALLKPGGLWVALTPNADAWKVRFFHGGWCWLSSDHYQIISAQAGRLLLEQAGLATVKIQSTRPAGYHYPGILIGWISLLKEIIKAKISQSKASDREDNESKMTNQQSKPSLTNRIFGLLGMIAKIERILLYPVDQTFGNDELLVVAQKKVDT